MTNQPLVSIILPTYNRANLLPRSIGSVLKQTYQNWELLVWDDGSTDNSKDMITALNEPRIQYFFAENRGVATARNMAIAQAQGEYLAFLDSDDEWLSEKLTIQVYSLQTRPAIDLLFSNFKNVNLVKNTTNKNFDDYQGSFNLLSSIELERNLFLIQDGFNESLARGNYIATDTVILKKDILCRNGLFNETLRNSEDFDLWWRLGLNNVMIAYHSQVLMTRFKPQGSLTSLNLASACAALEALNFCEKHAISAGREGLLNYLKLPYRNAWQNMITACAMENDKKGMMTAFKQSLKYGFRLGSLRLLLESLFEK